MSTHRVYIIWNHPLFYESIRLLLKGMSIDWLGASCNLIEARAEILSSHPDTILIEDEENRNASNQLVDLLEFGDTPIRIFRLNLSDNNLLIYHREQRTVLQAEDLVKLITEVE